MSERNKEKLLENEKIFRALNESMRRAWSKWPDCPVPFMCECSDVNCIHMVELDPSFVSAVEENPNQYLVLAGHEQPEVDRVVAVVTSQGHRFAVVEHDGRPNGRA